MLQQLLLQKKPREVADGSEILSKDVKEYFKCGQRPVASASDSLLSYNNEDKTKAILDAVVKLGTSMKQVKHNKWKKCEIGTVQPYVRDIFLPAVLECLDNTRFVELENERYYELKAMNDEGEILPVKGRTDHCAKIAESDCRAFVVEDKTICNTLSDQYIAQTRTEMMVEVRDTFEYYNYIPERYYGVLHNCSEWLFIERLVNGNNVHWSFVKLPPIFTDSDSGINLDNCKIVANFLEHVLKVADNIITDVRNYKFVTTKPPLISISEDVSDDDDNGDNDDGDEQDDDSHVADEEKKEEQARGQINSKPDRSTRRGTGLSSGHKHNMRTMRVINAYNAVTSNTDKENAYMPFTTANLHMQPTNFIKKI
jgi:hypothetical protein